MKKCFVLSLISLIFFFGCVSPIQYIGKTYPPTNNVDIYYSPHDVKKEYEVIGKASYTGRNLEKIQIGILDQAKKRGADGIIYSGIQSSENVANGTSYAPSRVLNADFIKYK